jgi:hypothetical protein
VGIIHACVGDVDLHGETDSNPSIHNPSLRVDWTMYVCCLPDVTIVKAGGLPSGQLPAYLGAWPRVASSVPTPMARCLETR